ncbi:MAG: sigma-70 family RNA polymerase sigma factor [Acidimicrobiales bacterium]|nr:sigma-70 family RNA polymerase sigma factor [Acidimicrobiales bacterium]
MATAPDEDLVTRLVDGDQHALAAVYDRYADRIHDFCARMLHDRADAADATQDTFLLAARRAGTLREPGKLRAWLYAIARSQCLGRLRDRKRTAPSDELEPAVTDEDPGRGAEQAETAALVHAAAAGLDERDQAALHLHLRHDLDGQALADAMGVTPANARKIAQRVRDRLERSLTALVVARRGSDDCEELASILGDWDGELTPLLRKRVSRHVDGCETCDEERKRSMTPAALLAAMPIASAPDDLRTRLISSIQAGEGPSGAAGPQTWDPSGFPAGGVGAGRRFVAAVAGLVVVAMFLGGAILGVVFADDDPVVEATATTTSSTTTTTDPTTTSTTTTDPTTTTTTAPATTTTAPPTSIVEPPPVTAPIDRTPPRLEVTADPDTIQERGGFCTGPSTSTVVAAVEDDGGVSAVRFRWPGPDGEQVRLVRDAPYDVTVGPYPSGHHDQATTVVVEVEAFDRAGNLATETAEIVVTPAGNCLG